MARNSRFSLATSIGAVTSPVLLSLTFAKEVIVEYVMLDVPRSRPIFNMPNLSFNSLVLSSYWSTA